MKLAGLYICEIFLPEIVFKILLSVSEMFLIIHWAKLSENGPEKEDLKEIIKIKKNNEKSLINNYTILLFPLNSWRWFACNIVKDFIYSWNLIYY